ncbi:MAG: MFS transporter [candidate division Zixibacteria bacterium]
MSITNGSSPNGVAPTFVARSADSITEYIQTVRLFSRNARLYLTALCITAVNFHVFLLLLNLYLKDFGFGEGEIGLVNSARSVGMTMMAIPAALVLSRIRIKPVLLVAVLLLAVLSLGLSSSEKFSQIILFGIASGMVLSIFRVAAGPFFMRNSTEVERTHLFSFSFAMWILAGMIGSIGSGKLVVLLTEMTGDSIISYRYTLYAGVAFCLLALIPFSLIKTAKPVADEQKIVLNRHLFRQRWSFYYRVIAVNLLIGMGAGLSIPFLNLYFRNRFGLEPDTIGLFYFSVMAAMLIGTLSGPLLAKRLGLVRTVVVTQVVSIPFMLILAYTHYLPLAFVAYLFRGGLMNMGMPLFNNLAMEISDEREQGLVNALLMIAWTSSWMISTAVGGELIERFGFTVSLNATVVLYLISTTVFYVNFARVEKRDISNGQWYIPHGTRM